MKVLLRELNDEQQVVIQEDNQSCLKMLSAEKFSNRTKHIATRFHLTKDQIEKGEVSCVYCPTQTMIADLLTKPVARIRTEKLVVMIGLTAAV